MSYVIVVLAILGWAGSLGTWWSFVYLAVGYIPLCRIVGAHRPDETNWTAPPDRQ